jgi:hypothetical protein
VVCPPLSRFADKVIRPAYAGRLGSGRGMVEAAEVRAAPPAREPPRAIDLLLEGLATLSIEGYAASVPPLKAGA